MISECPIFIKTTHADPELQKRLTWFLRQPGCKWKSVGSGEDGFPELTITRRGVFLSSGSERLSFHPSMALIRLINLIRGESDRYLEATGLRAGDVLLDATLGLGTDALVGAWGVGEEGRVIAIEQSPVLAAMVRDGLERFKTIIPHVQSQDKQQAWSALAQAAERITVEWGEHREFLSCLPSRSVDVIYFDPMFRHTREQSASIRPLHQWSDRRPLEMETIIEACRVARRRIVLKERKNSTEFGRLGFDIYPGGRYSQVDYGIILV